MLRIGFVLEPGFQMISLAAASAFELANSASGEELYTIEILSESGGPLANSLGIPIITQPIDQAALSVSCRKNHPTAVSRARDGGALSHSRHKLTAIRT